MVTVAHVSCDTVLACTIWLAHAGALHSETLIDVLTHRKTFFTQALFESFLAIALVGVKQVNAFVAISTCG
jgi:hypothetical protein